MVDPTRPIIVTSIPKAGTYLVSEVLKNLGFGQTWMHLSHSAKHFTRYDPDRLEEGKDHPARFKVQMPLDESLTLIGNGAFAVSHLPRTPVNERLLKRFRIIFVKRDLRDCLVSRLRVWLNTKRGRAFAETAWYRHPDRRQKMTLMLRDRGPELIGQMRAIAGWRGFPGAVTLSYEQIVARDLKGLLGAEGPMLVAAIDEALRTRTLTRSARPAKPKDYWSPDAESVFAEIGGLELNRALGYGRTSESCRLPPVASR